jgi:integrase
VPVLKARRNGADGKPLAADRYVFGNEIGERVQRSQTAWETACRRAGIANLHFHDLRREFACRLLESSAELHDVSDFLGHSNISTTSRYLRSSPLRLERALERLESAIDERKHAGAKNDVVIRTPFAHDSHPAADDGNKPTRDEARN